MTNTAKIHYNQKTSTAMKSALQLNPSTHKVAASTEAAPDRVTRNMHAQLNYLTRRGKMEKHLHEVYTVQYPESCACKVGKGLNPGTCYRFLPSSTSQCAPKRCKPSYICVIGMKTDFTCIRKVITSKISSNGDGTCKKIPTHNFAYVPYSE